MKQDQELDSITKMYLESIELSSESTKWAGYSLILIFMLIVVAIPLRDDFDLFRPFLVVGCACFLFCMAKGLPLLFKGSRKLKEANKLYEKFK